MNDLTNTKPTQSEDSVWASFNSSMDTDSLKSFCGDIERLFRINPLLEFNKWTTLGKNHYRFSGRNISNEEPFDFEVELKVEELTDGYRVLYTNSLKTSTTFKIGPSPQGSKLTITDNYDGLSAKERDARLGEVDRSITTWASYLQKFIRTWQRWSRFRPWRWYMRRVWQPMKPAGRRITHMLLLISLFEIALIALGVVIYFIEYA
ncbi:MAG: hypothetical protein GXP09_12955 [Gammaproteobacteria bacterium]|nr:hypothetical protein [Gammaproteobacteria bacterium]